MMFSKLVGIESLSLVPSAERDNLCFCDSTGALGGDKYLNHPHVRCVNASSGRTR
jgi:hypothetical protein